MPDPNPRLVEIMGLWRMGRLKGKVGGQVTQAPLYLHHTNIRVILFPVAIVVLKGFSIT